MDLERRGVPSGFIASCEFQQAAAAQQKSLGIKAARVFVPHSIQARTDEEMAELARQSIEKIEALVAENRP